MNRRAGGTCTDRRRATHLAEAPLPQDHDEVEIRELDAVLVAVAVVLAHRGRGGGGVCGLPWSHPRPLRDNKMHQVDWR